MKCLGNLYSWHTVGVSHLISLEYQNWVRDQEANFASGVSVDIQSLITTIGYKRGTKLEEGTFDVEYLASSLFSLLNLSILFSLLSSPQLWFCSTGNITWHCTHYICIEQEKLKRLSAVTNVQQTSIAVLSSATRFDLSFCSPLITSSVHQAPEIISNNQLVDNY